MSTKINTLTKSVFFLLNVKGLIIVVYIISLTTIFVEIRTIRNPSRLEPPTSLQAAILTYLDQKSVLKEANRYAT